MRVKVVEQLEGDLPESTSWVAQGKKAVEEPTALNGRRHTSDRHLYCVAKPNRRLATCKAGVAEPLPRLPLQAMNSVCP